MTMAVKKYSVLSVLPLMVVGFGLMVSGCASKPVVDPKSPAGAFAQSAAEAVKKGQTKEAIVLYRQSLAAEKKNPIALKGLAALHEVGGDVEAAKQSYKAALALDDEDSESRRALGRILIAQGFAEEAKEQFKTAYAQNEKDMKALVGYGVALDHLGQHDKAQAKYLVVIQHEAGDLSAINNLAYSYILSKDYDKAISLLETRLSNPGMTPAMRQNLALAYGLKGDMGNAERIAKMDLLPNQVKDNLAYYKKRRSSLAVAKPASVGMGPLATLPMAQIRAVEAAKLLKQADVPVKVEAVTEVDAIGGTPRFMIRFTPVDAKKPVAEKDVCQAVQSMKLVCGMRAGGI